MSGSKERSRSWEIPFPSNLVLAPEDYGSEGIHYGNSISGKQNTVSEGHPINRKTGKYDSGGPFYTSRVQEFVSPGAVKDAFSIARRRYYSGPIFGNGPSLSEKEEVGYQNIAKNFGDKNESSMVTAGTDALSFLAPTNPASNLGTTLAESYREGLPALPGVQLWRQKTEALKGAGSEYLNQVFGWLPLVDEVHSVGNAARHSRDVMKQYHAGEGSNTHRRFDFPSDVFRASLPAKPQSPIFPGPEFVEHEAPEPLRQVHLVRETKRWFEGCFTYALPSSTDSWGKMLGFGSQADQLFGIALTPDILWELTPWSWAVDWFSNAGEVVNNVSNFGLAGLVLRYGYVMEESIETVTAEGGGGTFVALKKPGDPYTTTSGSPWSSGHTTVTKRRVPASPFGFSIGWEGLSPTQLAITAALGITRLL